MRGDSLQSVARLLARGRDSGGSSALICYHRGPDIDALGSACAMSLALSSLGVSNFVLRPDVIPACILAHVDGVDFAELPARDEPLPGLVVALDSAESGRIPAELLAHMGKGPVFVNIDHHVSNPLWGDCNLVDPDSPSTTALLCELLEEMGVEISPAIASLLYAGLLTDTGCFCFTNTTAKTMRVASELISNGASPWELARALYYSRPFSRVLFQACAISQARLCLGGRVSLLALSEDFIEQHSATKEDMEGLVEDLKGIEGVSCAVFLRETSDGVRGSLRSKGPSFDVDKIASIFGGGGHSAAAGFLSSKGIVDLEEELLAELSKFWEEGGGPLTSR